VLQLDQTFEQSPFVFGLKQLQVFLVHHQQKVAITYTRYTVSLLEILFFFFFLIFSVRIRISVRINIGIESSQEYLSETHIFEIVFVDEGVHLLF